MKTANFSLNRSITLSAICAVALVALLLLGVASQNAQTTAQSNNAQTNTQSVDKKVVAKKPVPRGRGFATPQAAVDALIDAAEKYNVTDLKQILGPGSDDIVSTGEPARDKENAAAFAAQARTKQSIAKDPKNASRRTLIIGDEDWPFPVPIVKEGAKWYFDTPTGRHELLL